MNISGPLFGTVQYQRTWFYNEEDDLDERHPDCPETIDITVQPNVSKSITSVDSSFNAKIFISDMR